MGYLKRAAYISRILPLSGTDTKVYFCLLSENESISSSSKIIVFIALTVLL